MTHLVDGDSEVVRLVTVESGPIGGIRGDQPDRPQVLDGGRNLQTQLALAHYILEFVEHHGHSGRPPTQLPGFGQPTHDLQKPCGGGGVRSAWTSAAFRRFVTSVTLGGTSHPEGERGVPNARTSCPDPVDHPGQA